MAFSERQKFEALYDKYHRLVRNVLFNMTGESALDDLTQEAFLRIWRGLPRFGFRSTLKTWIYRITVNTAIDHLRRNRSKPPTTAFDDIPAPSPAGPGPAATIQAALAELEEIHRAVLILHYFEGLSVREIAGALEIPAGTVKSRLHVAREKLKTCLREKGMEP